MLPPEGAAVPASRILLISASGTGSGFSRRIERVVWMISNSPGSSELASDIGFVLINGAGATVGRGCAKDHARSAPASSLACARARGNKEIRIKVLIFLDSGSE